MALDPAPPDVSVAVSTHNRAAAVQQLIRALERQTLPVERFEVVVVDDASNDQTPTVLAELAASTRLRLTTVRLERNSGPAVGRNTAWTRSTAAVVAFTDDDCTPAPTWLENGLREIGERPSVLVGATEPDPEQSRLIDPLSRTMYVTHATFAPTCNVFYLRGDLEAVGGFDESFRVPIGEDTDLAWRVHREIGRPLVFCAAAFVHHDVRQRTLAQAARETLRWAGIAPVVARHTELARKAWHRGYFLRPSHPHALLALAGLLASPAFLPASLLVLPWLRRRLFYGRPTRRWLRDWRFAPAVFAIDLLEIAVLARASVKHRALIL